MVWMMLIMILPLAGIGLFFVLPLGGALPLYIILLAISATYHCLMMRALRLPLQMGPERMIGSAVYVRSWQGRRGQVVWEGEIWRAETSDGTALASGERVVIDGRSGLTLEVRPGSKAEAPQHLSHAVVNKCGVDRLLAIPQIVGRRFRPRGLEKLLAWPRGAERLAR